MSTIKLRGEVVNGQLKVELPPDLGDGLLDLELTIPEDRMPTQVVSLVIDCCSTNLIVSQANNTLWQREIGNFFGGLELIQTVVQFARDEHQLLIGRPTARMLLIDIGSVLPLEQEITKNLSGRHLGTGLPTRVEMSSIEIRNAIERVISSIEHGANTVLTSPFPIQAIPVEFKLLLQTQPLRLTGEYAFLKRLDERLQAFLGIPVVRADDEH